MRRLFLPLFFALAIAVTATILATSGMLPERVASHFASGGAANGWMSREAYVLIVLAMATLLPLFIVAMMARLPRMNPRRIRLPQTNTEHATSAYRNQLECRPSRNASSGRPPSVAR